MEVRKKTKEIERGLISISVHRESQKEKEGRNNRKEKAVGSETDIESRKERK